MAHYMVAVCDIANFHDNMKKYVKLSADLVAKHGGEYGQNADRSFGNPKTI